MLYVLPTSRRATRRPRRAERALLARTARPLVALGLACALASAARAQQPFDVALRDGLLSIRASGAPASSLAEALAQETGVRFVVTGDATRAISTEIVDEPLDRAIAKLSPNHLLVRDGERPDAPLVEVVLMLDDAAASAVGGGAEFLPSGAPADEIIEGVGGETLDDGAPAVDTLVPQGVVGPDGTPRIDGTPDPAAGLGDEGLPAEGAFEGAVDTMRALLRSRREGALGAGEELPFGQEAPLGQ